MLGGRSLAAAHPFVRRRTSVTVILGTWWIDEWLGQPKARRYAYSRERQTNCLPETGCSPPTLCPVAVVLAGNCLGGLRTLRTEGGAGHSARASAVRALLRSLPSTVHRQTHLENKLLRGDACVPVIASKKETSGRNWIPCAAKRQHAVLNRGVSAPVSYCVYALRTFDMCRCGAVIRNSGGSATLWQRRRRTRSIRFPQQAGGGKSEHGYNFRCRTTSWRAGGATRGEPSSSRARVMQWEEVW